MPLRLLLLSQPSPKPILCFPEIIDGHITPRGGVGAVRQRASFEWCIIHNPRTIQVRTISIQYFDILEIFSFEQLECFSERYLQRSRQRLVCACRDAGERGRMPSIPESFPHNRTGNFPESPVTLLPTASQSIRLRSFLSKEEIQ
jgi:hypothetical protein